MLVVDGFASLSEAAKFANEMQLEYERQALIFESQEESFAHDLYPFSLTPPIVLVERVYDDDCEDGWEKEILDSVVPFGGKFAGT